MRSFGEQILPRYLAALERSLDEAVQRVPAGKLRTALLRLRRRLRANPAVARFGALRRLAAIGEAQGWLEPEEAIVIQKLAYRVAFYAARMEERWDD